MSIDPFLMPALMPPLEQKWVRNDNSMSFPLIKTFDPKHFPYDLGHHRTFRDHMPLAHHHRQNLSPT